ncbi:Phosphatidylinositol 4-kinase pik1alpha (PI4-kinase)(PtdIns-4-kinase), partial [Coemansia sp. RSA 2399]
MQSRRSYLTKATKQFQRNAKTFDRKLGRSFDDTLRMRSRSHILHPDTYSDPCRGIGGTSDTQHTQVQADLDDMGVYMEKERRKLERRSSYFGSEIRFMTALMDISRRVCAVAKAGRQQFLKAELTLLNHSLDKHTCIPLWCPESGAQHHHRIVRIPTEDTVVLNSAERAPYLLTLEVLDPDESTSPEDPCAELSAGDTVPSAREVDSEHAGKWTSAPTHKQSTVAPAAVEAIDNDSAITEDSDTECVTGLNNAQSTVAASAGDSQHTISTTRSFSLSDDADKVPHTVEQPHLEPSKEPEQQSSPVVEDVDEKLMAEVFGDIDDISDIPEPPLSPATNRQHSGSYGRTRVASRPAQRKSGLVENYSTGQETNATSAMKSQRQEKHSNDHSAIQQHAAGPESLNSPPVAGRSGTTLSRMPVSQDEIRARMRTASVLLAQLARQQKALGIKVNKLFIPQIPDSAQGDSGKARSDASETPRRRSKLNNATAQALAMEEIRKKLIHEMMQLEEIRLKQPGLDSLSGSAATQSRESGGNDVDGEMDMHQVEFKDDPSAKVLKEDWESKKARIRRTSPYGRYKNWNLLSVIVKEGSDLRQEQLALQLICEIQRIWKKEQADVFVQYYRIIVTGEGCGLMETITNTVSVHSIKKEFYSRNPDYAGPPYTLYNYFITTYGTPDTERFRIAQDCFVRSLVSYSLITYILQIRDRHNGNILLDTEGHVIHIDFGFMLSNSPGSVGFEQAPFKFPMEYVDILGGRDSAKFAEFRALLISAFLSLRKHAENLCLLVEMMLKGSPLPCLSSGVATVNALRDRFHPALSEQQIEELVDSMLISSCDNMTT